MFTSVHLTRWIYVYLCPSHLVNRCLLLSVTSGGWTFTSAHHPVNGCGEWTFTSVRLTQWMDIYFCPSHPVNGRLLLPISLGEQTFTSVSPGNWTFISVHLTCWTDIDFHLAQRLDVYFCPSHLVNGRLLLSISPGEWTFYQSPACTRSYFTDSTFLIKKKLSTLLSMTLTIVLSLVHERLF